MLGDPLGFMLKGVFLTGLGLKYLDDSFSREHNLPPMGAKERSPVRIDQYVRTSGFVPIPWRQRSLVFILPTFLTSRPH